MSESDSSGVAFRLLISRPVLCCVCRGDKASVGIVLDTLCMLRLYGTEDESNKMQI
jgi:hypothetical protein